MDEQQENRRDGRLREQAGRNAREASMSSPRMAKRTATTKATSHTTQCFAELLSRDPELSALRADYAQKPAAKRRAAAEWVYDEGISNSLFGAALARLQGERLLAPKWPQPLAP